MRDTVLKLIELEQAAQPLRYQIDAHVKQRVVDYVKAQAHRDVNRTDDYPTKPTSIDEWHIDGEDVVAHWDEYWNFGGHADGCVVMPARFLYDEEEFKNFVKFCEQTLEETKREQAEKRRAEDERAFEQLKQKLGK